MWTFIKIMYLWNFIGVGVVFVFSVFFDYYTTPKEYRTQIHTQDSNKETFLIFLYCCLVPLLGLLLSVRATYGMVIYRMRLKNRQKPMEGKINDQRTKNRRPRKF